MTAIRHFRKEEKRDENSSSLESVLYKFTLPSVPKRGREEEHIDPPAWRVSTQAPTAPARAGLSVDGICVSPERAVQWLRAYDLYHDSLPCIVCGCPSARGIFLRSGIGSENPGYRHLHACGHDQRHSHLRLVLLLVREHDQISLGSSFDL